MAKVNFRLVMPERELLATEADMVVVPGSEGDFGVLHGHAPLISTVRAGVLCDLKETIRGFKGLVNGDYDHLPEPAFYMVGTIDEAIAKAKKMASEA